ncbi:HhH-GPD family protein [Corynebacterium diphtheriae]|uniref:A/G-specific adenine glycosylase n=1 Tax=Corynebacterium diphtheriae TaxID=1717 RepID=UPI0002468392|nr:A/G-specific adenine glycosylase [Corynebacterium diphtheriae]AEX72835.1 A/G-specific adenine glycosylase [Corynebacterium diphtheriae CDCE 8392]MCM0017363.1 A/G-specific adenine glycosylase [Corynebacterium diphtheriae bv. mitis]MCM0027072.1 A/G-specific adenine glycosylase [Corynebacterium diphtheriae bv. mitis]MCM0029666.1 A/G-specific adenine glycosylase [Corynebacterium diphtheriae bv. mitis]MCM0037979.1 A/G-specific adenine glycosylase [Corynebacterium diphtheriae bv. mitis]
MNANNVENIPQILTEWYRKNARSIVWRTPQTSAWGVLLSEVMSQQTPVARVEPIWVDWMRRWPTPADFAQAGKDEVLRAWDRLGYPRRALRLHECAQQIVERHGGEVPHDVEQLLALPGIGDYTARAVAAFAFGQRVAVVDTNVRRVHHRVYQGIYLAGNASKRELREVEALLPHDNAPEFSVALMELGALVCQTTPQCDRCPLTQQCRWITLGRPMPSAEETAKAKKRVQKFVGTDRQVRGLIMAVLRNAEAPVPQSAIDVVWPDAAQRSRALFSLLDDGLATQNEAGLFSLPT